MIAPLLSLMALGIVLGGILGVAGRFFKVEANPLETEIEAMLPGSQCGQCGYPGCGPAAAAVAEGSAPVTLCPPGGRSLAEALAAKLGVSVDLSDMEDKPPSYAHIRESLCIGCTKCFKRCPTDAIVGGPKQIHAVFRDACTGCEQCFEVCPTECIEMRPVEPTLQTWYWPKPSEVA
ncbi:MAG: RnfABCDGE type electron transport complex subunit B [Pseudomonadota bacterium]|nr:RnfABCDGE type electron transport complex subunit B [Pseudomonadota bacterium]